MTQQNQTVWVTSDIHFHHANILKFNPETRQHSSIEAMNEFLIQDWNSKVAPFSDTVYILGDFCFGNVEKAVSILKRLNGRKILVQGNHDEKLVQDKRFRDEFESIHVYHEISYNGAKVCMMHYPILSWNRAHKGSYMLHGHLHGSGYVCDMSKYRIADVGVDAICKGSSVILLDQVLDFLKDKKDLDHH